MSPSLFVRVLDALRHPTDDDLQEVADDDTPDDALAPVRRARVLEHVARCARCRTRLHHARSIHQMLSELQNPPADLLGRIMERRRESRVVTLLPPLAPRPRLPSAAAVFHAAATVVLLLAGSEVVMWHVQPHDHADPVLLMQVDPVPASSAAPPAEIPAWPPAAETGSVAREALPDSEARARTGRVLARQLQGRAPGLSITVGGSAPASPGPAAEPPGPAIRLALLAPRAVHPRSLPGRAAGALRLEGMLVILPRQEWERMEPRSARAADAALVDGDTVSVVLLRLPGADPEGDSIGEPGRTLRPWSWKARQRWVKERSWRRHPVDEPAGPSCEPGTPPGGSPAAGEMAVHPSVCKEEPRTP